MPGTAATPSTAGRGAAAQGLLHPSCATSQRCTGCWQHGQSCCRQQGGQVPFPHQQCCRLWLPGNACITHQQLIRLLTKKKKKISRRAKRTVSMNPDSHLAVSFLGSNGPQEQLGPNLGCLSVPRQCTSWQSAPGRQQWLRIVSDTRNERSGHSQRRELPKGLHESS